MPRPSKANLQARRRETQRLTIPDPTTPPDADLPTPGHEPAVQFEPLLTVDQVAEWLGKPKATLYAWRTRGQGPRGIKVGCDLRYRRSDVEAYLEEHADHRDFA